MLQSEFQAVNACGAQKNGHMALRLISFKILKQLLSLPLHLTSLFPFPPPPLTVCTADPRTGTSSGVLSSSRLPCSLCPSEWFSRAWRVQQLLCGGFFEGCGLGLLKLAQSSSASLAPVSSSCLPPPAFS